MAVDARKEDRACQPAGSQRAAIEVTDENIEGERYKMSGILQAAKKMYGRKNKADYFWKLRNAARKGRMFSVWRYKKHMLKFGAGISAEAEIEDVPVFPHGIFGIFVSAGARIGKNCVIFHQVTIGSNTLAGSRNAGSPVIGDNVYIGCGAKIIGNVKIGNNVRIGANCVVTSDVADNCTVVLSQPRIICREGMQDNRFISYKKYKEKRVD